MSKVLIDTNLFLDDSNIIFKLAREYDEILLPLVVLRELDAHKMNSSSSFSARKAIQSIMEFREREPNRIIFDVESHKNLSEGATNDDKIIHSAQVHEANIATKDTSMAMQAEALGLEPKLYDVVLNHIFEPYKYIHMNVLYELTEEDIFAFNKYYDGTEYAKMLNIFSKACDEELDRDSWFFIFINVDKESPVIYANNVKNHLFQRIDDDPKYIYIETEASTLRARDKFQKCAIFALKEAPHCLITGRWGSGKTLLGTAYALAENSKKPFITRAPIGINTKYDLGFLPGDKKDKMIDWMQGFMSALYFLYANTRGQKDEKNGRIYDFVKDTLFHQKFELMPMNTIQGLSLLDGDTLIVDEAQLITVDYMSMILSRPSVHGKLILLGDLKQTYGVVKPSESGLLKLLRTLPHRSLAYVKLENSYRSPLLEVADKLQDKTY